MLKQDCMIATLSEHQNKKNDPSHDITLYKLNKYSKDHKVSFLMPLDIYFNEFNELNVIGYSPWFIKAFMDMHRHTVWTFQFNIFTKYTSVAIKTKGKAYK